MPSISFCIFVRKSLKNYEVTCTWVCLLGLSAIMGMLRPLISALDNPNNVSLPRLNHQAPSFVLLDQNLDHCANCRCQTFHNFHLYLLDVWEEEKPFSSRALLSFLINL